MILPIANCLALLMSKVLLDSDKCLLSYLTLLAPGFFGWCSTGGGGRGVFHPIPNSFGFEVKLLKFCTELLCSKRNILRQKNPDQIDNDVTMTSSLLC